MENIAASELDKEPRTLPEYIGMYDLSGFGRIRVHDFERYERAKSQLSQIESANEKSLKKLSFDIRKADFYNKIDVIERGISDKDPKKITTSLRFVSTIPPKDALRIVQLGLDSGDSETESECSNAINYVPYIDRGRLIARLANKIESGLLRNNPDDFNNYCQMSRNVPEDQKNRIRILIKEKMLDGFDNPDPEQKIKYLEGLRFMSDEDSQLASKRLKEVMSDIFSGDDEHSKIIMAKALRFLPADDRPSFVLEALRSQNKDLRREYSKHLLYMKGEGRVEAVKFCLQDNDPELQKNAIRLVNALNQDEKHEATKKLIFSAEGEVLSRVAGVLEQFDEPDKTELKDEFKKRLTTLLNSGTDKQKFKASFAIGEIPIDEREEYIKMGLSSQSPDAQKVCLWMITKLPEEMRGPLFELAKREMGNRLVEPILYIGRDGLEHEFSRVNFEKTGGELTLLGGDLKNKAIIKHTDPDSFLAWFKLYDNHEGWKQNGYDYVPIEPIDSFRLNSQGKVDVFTGVLDMTVASWTLLTNDFRSEILEDCKRIEEIAGGMGVTHNDTHRDNFCLRFFRDDNGNIDFSKKPRVYMIDFDSTSINS